MQLNSVESLCQSPNARDSIMTKKLLELLHTEMQTDMVFEIIIVQGVLIMLIEMGMKESVFKKLKPNRN